MTDPNALPRRLRHIHYAVAEKAGVRVIDLLAPHGGSRVCDAKHVAWLILWRKCGIQQKYIAKQTGFASATIARGIRKVEDLLSIDDPRTTQLYDAVTRSLTL